MNDQCKFCNHKNVCAYKNHYDDVIKLYEKAIAECGKYPYFKFKIKCVQYMRDCGTPRGLSEQGDKNEDE